MARAALAWEVQDLGRKAEVSDDAILRFERGQNPLPRTIEALRSTLEEAGITFIPEGGKEGGGVGVRLNPGSIPAAPGPGKAGPKAAEPSPMEESPARKLVEQARVMQKAGTNSGEVALMVMRSVHVIGEKVASRQDNVAIPTRDGAWINYNAERDEWSLDREPLFR